MPLVHVHSQPQVHKRLGRRGRPIYWLVCTECGTSGPHHDRATAEAGAQAHAEGHRRQPVTRIDHLEC